MKHMSQSAARDEKAIADISSFLNILAAAIGWTAACS